MRCLGWVVQSGKYLWVNTIMAYETPGGLLGGACLANLKRSL